MVHESVLDAIHDDSSDYDDGAYEDEADGELQSGFQAMDITSSTPKPSFAPAADDGAARIREFEPGKNHPKKKKKKRRKGENRRRQQQQQQPVCIEQFVVQTCRRIDEPKYPLFREAVDRIGVDAMKALLNQVDVVEKCGGQMTADGLRRRSAGGVLWILLRDQVGPGLYKEIMKEGNRKHIEQQKARLKERENERGDGKRQHVEVEGEERQNFKRRRTSDGRSVSRDRSVPRASLREEVDSARTPAALQNAWIQGLKKHSEFILNPKPSEGKGSGFNIKKPVAERIRMTVSYGDLADEATDSPIGGVTGIGVENRGEMNEEVQEEGEIREEGEIGD